MKTHKANPFRFFYGAGIAAATANYLRGGRLAWIWLIALLIQMVMNSFEGD